MRRIFNFSISMSIREVRIQWNGRVFAWDFPLFITGLHRTPVFIKYSHPLPTGYGDAIFRHNYDYVHCVRIGDTRYCGVSISLPVRSPWRPWTRRKLPVLHVWEMNRSSNFTKLIAKKTVYSPALMLDTTCELAEKYVRGIPTT